jgi:NitT/TauT family transport system ATP-binding protein
VPTTYPKSSPTETMGLLVLLNQHKGSEDVALLADDLDLEIDEILPSIDYAEVLGLVKVADGRATFTDLGRRLVGATIRERKAILREQLRRTTLFKTLLRALENSPERCLTDEQLAQIVSFTAAPADDAVQNIVNWGRYTELFRYDAADRRLVAGAQSAPSKETPPPGRSPPPGSGHAPASASGRSKGTAPGTDRGETRTAPTVAATA